MEKLEVPLILLLLGLLMFSWPALAVFKAMLPLYLFLAWGLFILLIYLLARDRGDSGEP